MNITASLVDNIPAFESALGRKLSAVVRKAAFDVEAKAKLAAPVDLGFLKASIFTVTASGSGASAAQAASARRAKGRRFAASVETVRNPYVAYVVAGASYAVYVEWDHPFLLPAADAVRPELERAIRAIFEKG